MAYLVNEEEQAGERIGQEVSRSSSVMREGHEMDKWDVVGCYG